jgi:hypothetical protein
MPWLAIDLDGTLLDQQPGEDGEPQDMPMEGAVEAMQQLVNEGHKLTVFTARFAPMPDSERYRLKQEIEKTLAGFGFPEMEVWTGTSKPGADVFIDNKAVTFDGDWGLALAQTQAMLEDQGLGKVQPYAGEESGGEEPQG